MIRGIRNNMSFQRVGTPMGINALDFKEGVVIACQHCGKTLGKKLCSLVKVAGANSVLVSPTNCVCPHCHKENKGV